MIANCFLASRIEMLWRCVDDEILFSYETGLRYDLVEILNVANENPSVCEEMFNLIKARYQYPLLIV